MKKLLFIIILIFLLLSFPILGANTYSIDLEASSAQHLLINDGDQTGLDLTGDFTLELWVKFESMAGSYQNPVFIAKCSAGQWAYYFQYAKEYGPNAFRLGISANGTNVEYLKKAWAPDLATWYHITVTFDASAATAEFFVDGLSIGTDTGTYTSMPNGTAPFRIGSYLGSYHYLDGLIDEVRVWNDIRTDSEINDNKCVELVGNEANLKAYWKLNNDALDETTNNNDLTEFNSPVYSVDTDPCFAVARRIIENNKCDLWTINQKF